MASAEEEMAKFETREGRSRALPRVMDGHLDGLRIQMSALGDALSAMAGIIEALSKRSNA